jgi:hypothetical protein
VDPQTFRRWADPRGKYYKPEFADALSKGMNASLAWWCKLGRSNLKNRHFNAASDLIEEAKKAFEELRTVIK